MCASLKEIHLCEGLRSIGERAFCVCTSLERISIPSTVHAIPDWAFRCCIALKEVRLVEGLRLIGDDAFRDCRALTSIAIPSTVEEIGSASFRNCPELKGVHLCDGLRRIGNEAFHGCTSLAPISIPSSVEAIGAEAFRFCCFSTIHLSVRELSDGAFGFSRVKHVHLCEGTKTISTAFRHCLELTRISIPSTVATIDAKAFQGCSSLKEIQLNEGLLSIGRSAFSFSPLKCVCIPSTVASIDRRAFGWSSLVVVRFCEGLASTGTYSISHHKDISFIFSNITIVTLFVGLLSIASGAFSGCKSLLTINVPSSVASIEKDTFVDCSYLRNISISPSSNLGQDVEFESTFSSFAKVGCTFDLLRSRFDGFPVHRLCFYHLHQTVEPNNTYEQLKEMIQIPTSNSNAVDCLGMTPLHVLACSGTHELRLYRCLIEKYPDALITKDKWGDTPLAYVLLSESSMDIVHYFFEVHRRLWGTIPIDFGEIIKIISSRLRPSAGYVKYTIRAQRTYFPDLKIDWNHIIQSLRVDKDLMKAIFFAGSSEMSSERKAEVQRRNSEYLDRDIEEQKKMFKASERFIVDSMQEYHDFLIDTTTVLELVLWRMLLNDASQQRKRKRIIDGLKVRKNTRLNGGKMFQVVIPNVLSFL